MKVLMFGWEFPPCISGGLGTACYGLTSGLIEKNAEIVFVVPRITGPAETRRYLRLINGKRVRSTWKNTDATELFRITPIDSFLAPYMTEDSWKTTTKSAHDKARKSKKGAFSENYGPDMYGEVFRYSETAGIIASRESFDVIHAHDWMTIPAGFAARNKTGKPLVIHIHSVESDRSPMRLNERIYGIERIGMTKADHIIAVSNYTKRKIMDEYGIPEKKISVVYNAPTSFGPCGKSSTARKDGKKYVLFMGRITSQKGPVYFLEMAKRIALLNPDIHFIMAGSGDMTDKIKKAAADYGIEDRLRFTGFLRGREVQKAYEASDIFVMPSVSEPFGITALEAISCGIPAVISGQSGVSEVLKSCPMVDFRNTNALADTVIEILGSDTLQKEIVAACKKEMLQLDWKTSAEKIINIYHRLVV